MRCRPPLRRRQRHPPIQDSLLSILEIATAVPRNPLLPQSSQLLDRMLLLEPSFFDTSRASRTTRAKAARRAAIPWLQLRTSTAFDLAILPERRTRGQSQTHHLCLPSRRIYFSTTRTHTRPPRTSRHTPAIRPILMHTGHHPAWATTATVEVMRRSSTISVVLFLLRLKALSHSGHYAKPIWMACLAATASCHLVIDADACVWIASRTSHHARAALESMPAAIGGMSIATSLAHWII